MLVGETFVRVDREAFGYELAAFTVPPVFGLFLLGESAAAGRTEELNRLIIVSGLHMIHHSITILRRSGRVDQDVPQTRRGSKFFSGHSSQKGLVLQ